MNMPHMERDEGLLFDLATGLTSFAEFGRVTRVEERQFELANGTVIAVPFFFNEFWTSKQRQANPLHEISYRACFKPQLPRFFVERLTRPGDVVYDPMMGRNTTGIESALLGRVPYGSDVNPLAVMLSRPRLYPPTPEQVSQRLQEIDFNDCTDIPTELLVFFHPQTLKMISSLRAYLLCRQTAGELDPSDDRIRMVALNRLTGHSPGFFSVYTLPPNQAVSAARQRIINAEGNQVPPLRDVPALILKKTRQLLRDCDKAVLKALQEVGSQARFFTKPAGQTPDIPDNSVSLVVTSPPFLDVVDYAGDNWLRCWFAGIDPAAVRLTICRKLDDWQQEMTRIFRELHRVVKPGGHIAFEVGEVRSATIRLEEAVIPSGMAAGLQPLLVLINEQTFTKTANCWGIENNTRGTNTNRIVLFRK
jgi:hypothetical protein